MDRATKERTATEYDSTRSRSSEQNDCLSGVVGTDVRRPWLQTRRLISAGDASAVGEAGVPQVNTATIETREPQVANASTLECTVYKIKELDDLDQEMRSSIGMENKSCLARMEG